MSNNQSNPTQNEIRYARRIGYADSIANMPEDRQHRLYNSYEVQDARRERNISQFYNSVVAGS